MSRQRTGGVALPASASLPVAGAVHHVALVVALGELLVYFIGKAVDDALICTCEHERERERKIHDLMSDGMTPETPKHFSLKNQTALALRPRNCE